MDIVDDSELWMSDEEGGEREGEDEEDEEDATFFQLDLTRQGISGGYHVRNKPGEKQRRAVAGWDGGSKKKPAFHVSCTAKAIIHGTLDLVSRKPATLLVYDFCFFSYRSTRIKEASIHFEFRPKQATGAGELRVHQITPYGTHMMMQTTQTETRTLGVNAGLTGGVGVNAEAGVNAEKAVEKTTTHAVEITGDNPFDDYGNYYTARWSLKENDSQRKGIVTLLRTCICLTRDTDEEFSCIPTIEAKPNFRAQLGSLFAGRTPDDPIPLDPSYEPYNALDPPIEIDRRNLGAVGLDSLWDCTFHKTFGNAVKTSRSVAGASVEEVKTVEEVKVAVS